MKRTASPRATWLAHDHQFWPEDFKRDLAGGVTGKIVHLSVDGWIEAPTREQYEAAYYSDAGFFHRIVKNISRVLEQASTPGSRLAIIRNATDLASAAEQGRLALVLGSEGGKIIEDDLELLDALWRLGLRHMQLNWAMRNRIAASQSNETEPDQPGLTEFGRSVIERMNELGIVIDVSHSSPQTIKDVLGLTRKPILNSHSGSRALAPKLQNLWDDQIKDMAANGGVVAIHFCSRLVLGVNDRQSEIPDVIRQIKYVRDVGGIDVVGLGPDWVLGHPERDVPYLRNTNQESISWTRGLESSAEMPNLLPALEEAGFKDLEIEKILGGNIIRLLRDVLPAR
ncbi:MAG: hypothetical protein FJ314_08225 [SAR202 cluster bacterium]|nr:hypothetical protein [SAR202 cluster bacterium]